MNTNFDLKREKEHFDELWDYRRPSHVHRHTKKQWDKRAFEWEEELRAENIHREAIESRVAATIQYLRGRGVLQNAFDVIDVGCGPGRFVSQFAKHVHHVVGTDLSGQMLRFGENYAKEIGVLNVSFVEENFLEADIDQLGWRGRFDLVFSSITPAIIGSESLNKLMEISRGWCFNSSFVCFEDSLERILVQEVLHKNPKELKSERWHRFYALFNKLWLDGYYPETSYYQEDREEDLVVNENLAEEYCDKLEKNFGTDMTDLRGNVLDCLKGMATDAGTVHSVSQCKYGWLLWNVEERTSR